MHVVSPLLEITDPPQTDEELWELVYTLWNVQIPRQRVCANHVAPFDAFANAFFGRDATALWIASRGFGGKSFLLAILGLMYQVVYGAEVSILGGSGEQSERVHQAMKRAWNAPLAPREMLRSDPTKRETFLENGGHVRTLMASQTSVRGPHPQKLLLDECDAMTLPILDAALGQPLSTPGIPAQVIMSSTHHVPNGTVTELLRRATAQGFPVYRWCYLETMEPHGWLPLADVEVTRGRMTARQFQIEIELQEPAFEDRAILPEAVEAAFRPEWGEDRDRIEGEWEWAPPVEKATYATGADWAKTQDWTVIRTFRTDVAPWQEVATARLRRMPWPQMVARFAARLQRYPGPAAHDATGLGSVVADYIPKQAPVPVLPGYATALINLVVDYPPKVMDIVLTGYKRQELFSEYIAALEQGALQCPRLEWLYGEHKYCSRKDLYGSGHPPDSVVAGALAWACRRQRSSGWVFR